jgi:hypothetical protein
LKVEQMKGRARSEGKWREVRFITNLDDKNGNDDDDDDSPQVANTTVGSCQNDTSNN